MHSVNILITSVGRRTSLLNYFKKELVGYGSLIAVDCSDLAPALYVADRHYIVPRIDEPNYINFIKEICIKEKVVGIFSLIDPELSLLARYKNDFEKIGTTIIVSPFDVCELCLDKYAMSKFCQNNGIMHAKTYRFFSNFTDALKNDEINFPVFIKPRKGSASLNINIARNINEAKTIFESIPGMIIQEFLKGQEIGIDVYVDLLSKEIIATFIKEKIAMRAGETDKARSIKINKLFGIVSDLVRKVGLVGPIDIDVFNVDGEYYISEINPRFGGGYPHAYECGVNFPKFVINNLRGIENEVQIGNYDENVFLMKYDSVLVKHNLR